MKYKQIDWSNHLIELCVVFISITLAFMLNNWRENHTDQLMAEKYINSFRNDIANDYTELDSIMKANERKLLRINNFINSLKEKKATIADAERIMGDLAELNPFYPELSTFESIKFSGNLNILTDYNFREKLIQYYQSLEEKKLVEEVNMNYTNNYIIPFIHKHADFLNQRIINEDVLSNYNFTNLVLGHYQLLVQIIDNYKRIYKLNRELELILAKK